MPTAKLKGHYDRLFTPNDKSRETRSRGRIRDLAWNASWMSDLACSRQWTAEKIVYSRTLAEPRSARTKIERSFDPDGVRKLKANVASDIAVAGPELAEQAIQSGLVDELQMRVCPVLIGGGKRYLPSGVRLDMELVEEGRLRNGEMFLRYAVRGQSK
jgi:riboflavin biosynthesis pyrimidine reductase